jgi:hypothetical protein
VRIILAVIVTACAIAVLIDSPRRELAAQLRADWQEYRQHVGDPVFPRLLKISQILFRPHWTQNDKVLYFTCRTQGAEDSTTKQGAER